MTSTSTTNSTCACSMEAPPPKARRRDVNRQVDEIVRFHGHMCPGLALGIRAAEAAVREIGPHSADEEVVAIVETNMCAVDAIQFVTGCTFGKGNLIHVDHGKNAYTFVRRSDGKAVRIVARPTTQGSEPERLELFAKVRSGDAGEADRTRFKELQRLRSQEILDAPEPEVQRVEQVALDDIPQKAQIYPTVVCDGCGEGTMQPRIRELAGRRLCPACAQADVAA